MTEKFIELTEIVLGQADEDDREHKVLINLRAVSHFAPHHPNSALSLVYFNEEEYLLVRETYEQIIDILGWVRMCNPRVPKATT